MKRFTYHSPIALRALRGPWIAAVCAVALAVFGAGGAAAQTAQTTTRVVSQANDGGNANLRGCVRIDIEVDPTSPVRVPIRDLHLLVAVSRHTQQGDATVQGDRLAVNYADRTANMPAGWQYAGLIAVASPNRPGEMLWFATWHSPQGMALPGKATFSLLYCGERDVAEQPGILVITNAGSVDPRMGQVAVLKAHAPK
jgi:hypothetical protein